jgi:hypothetical protein
MTIVRSLGVSTLVALMSAHRAAAEQYGTADRALDQATVDAFQTYLNSQTERVKARHDPVSEKLPSCN